MGLIVRFGRKITYEFYIKKVDLLIQNSCKRNASIHTKFRYLSINVKVVLIIAYRFEFVQHF